jgi:hypothetical protein
MKTAVEQALESLQQKRKHFIGNHRDSSSIDETKGFLQGLDWAIDTIETAIENERCEEEWRSEQLELELTKQQEQ